MHDPCPKPRKRPFLEEAEAAIGLLVEWSRRCHDPGETATRVAEACEAFRRAIEGLCHRVAASWGPDEDRGAWGDAMTGLVAWSAAHQPLAEHSLRALPREALVAIQNLGRAAFIALLTRSLGESPHREEFLDVAERKRHQTEGGRDVRASDAASSLLCKLIGEDRKARLAFASVAKFDAYLRPRLRSEVRDLGNHEVVIDRPEGIAAGRQPVADLGTPSGRVGDAEIEKIRRNQEAAAQAEIDRWPARRRAALFLRFQHDWDFTDIAEVIHGDEVRPEAVSDAAERKRRAVNRDTKAKEIKRDLSKAMKSLGLDEPPPRPRDEGPGR